MRTICIESKISAVHYLDRVTNPRTVNIEEQQHGLRCFHKSLGKGQSCRRGGRGTPRIRIITIIPLYHVLAELCTNIGSGAGAQPAQILST
jgi:hypothetical protein